MNDGGEELVPEREPVKLYMVLPAYYEAENLDDLLANLEIAFGDLEKFGYAHEYVIVDDGSRDATPEILARAAKVLPIQVLTHKQNQGLGPTIRDGLRKASEISKHGDIILAMDADNTHPAGLVPRMVSRIHEGNDIVIASRYRYGAQTKGLSRFRAFLSLGARVLFQIVFPIKGVRDYTCGYRAYRASLLKRAFALHGDGFVEYRGFQSMADILLKLSRMGATITEVPMVLRYDLKGGETKMRVSTTVLNTIKLLFKRRIQWLFERSAGTTRERKGKEE